jgi:hypothetical protein
MEDSTITLNLSEINKNCVQDKENPDKFICNILNSSGGQRQVRGRRENKDSSNESKNSESNSELASYEYLNVDSYYEHNNSVQCLNSYTGFSKTNKNSNMTSNICLQNCKDSTPFFEYENNYPVCKYRPTITYKADSDIPDNITCSDGFLVSSNNQFPGISSDSTDQFGMCIGLPLSYDPAIVVNQPTS